MTSGNGTTGSDTTDNPPADSTGNGTTDGGLDSTGNDDTPPGTTDGGLDSTGTDSAEESSGGPMGACDAGMSFATLTSTDNDMVTNLDVAGVVSCNLDITLTVTGGTVCIIDDGAGGNYVTVETLTLEDVPPVMCGPLAQVGLSNISIVNTGDFMEVTAPAAGGAMTGNQSIQVLGDVEGMALGMAIAPTPLMDFAGVLPEGDAAFGADTTLSYADNSTVVATAMPMVSGFTITVTLTGLDGSLTFAP